MKTIRVFSSEFFQLLNVKFSIYLNRCVFVILYFFGIIFRLYSVTVSVSEYPLYHCLCHIFPCHCLILMFSY